MDECNVEWNDNGMDGWMNSQSDAWMMVDWMRVQFYGWMDRWMDATLNGRITEWMDGCSHSYIFSDSNAQVHRNAPLIE